MPGEKRKVMASMPLTQASADQALAITGLSKRFGATQALDSVDFTVRRGTIHALLGHNGSGKSTLIKTLGGYHSPDAGEIVANGHSLPARHTALDAYAAGVRFVHQDLGLIADLSVAENLALGTSFQTVALGTISWKEQHERCRRRLRQLRVAVDPRTLVRDLGPVDQTLVAITRALQDMDHRHGLLILDEPTARLPRSEVMRLLGILRELKGEGVSMIYVTHRLDEVFEVADDVTILRNGRSVFQASVADTTETAVRRYIAGRDIGAATAGAGDDDATRRRGIGDVLVSLRGVSGERVHGVDLDLRAGEMVAIIGLVGSGRSELGRLVYGLQPLTSGTVRMGRSTTTRPSPSWATHVGIGYVPQDRASGLAEMQSIAENLAVTSFGEFRNWLGVRGAAVARMARQVISRLGISPSDGTASIGTLSGGNQQKVALGKWVRRDVSLIIMDEPLQGIDIGAKLDILETIRKRVLANGGAALWLESDIEFVPIYADRVLVMRDGSIISELDRRPIEREDVLMALYGTEQR